MGIKEIKKSEKPIDIWKADKHPGAPQFLRPYLEKRMTEEEKDAWLQLRDRYLGRKGAASSINEVAQ